MPSTCPVCETDNLADAAECRTCGKVFSVVAAATQEDLARVPGLEQTLHDPAASALGAVERLPELEQTMLARRDLRVAAEVVPGVERTRLEEDPGVTPLWSGGVTVDSGREPDDGLRTPAPPDSGACPWCGVASLSAVCDSCGRRRSRYTSPPAPEGRQAALGEHVLCPGCFARVPGGERCAECGVPLPALQIA